MATVAVGKEVRTGFNGDKFVNELNLQNEDSVSDSSHIADLPMNYGEVKQRYIAKYFNHPSLSRVEQKIGESFNIMDNMVGNESFDEKKSDSVIDTVMPLNILGEYADRIFETMKNIEQLIVYEKSMEEEEKTHPAELPELDAVSHASLIGHCLTAYISTLNESHMKAIASKITADCQAILTLLFRLSDAHVYYHYEEREGLVKVCKLALHQKYPKYGTEGFEALYSRPPVIYLSSASPVGLGQHLCTQLGLPMSCISMVPCNTMFGASSKMDVAMLEKLIQDDIAAAKTPVLLVGYAGTPVVGHVDNLKRLQEICSINGIWLHVEGNNLASLILFSDPNTVQASKCGDSITVTLGKWLGIPSLQATTLYMCEDTTMTYAAGMNSFNAASKLSCLPLWICLHSLGHDGIHNRIRSSFHLCKLLLERLSSLPTVKLVNTEKKSEEKDSAKYGDLLSTSIDTLLVFDVVTPTVIFRYTENSTKTETESTPYVIKTSEESNEDEKQTAYYNALNTWLADLLLRENTKILIEAVNVDKEGVCVRFSPLEFAQVLGTTEEDIEDFVSSLQAQIVILDATVSQRKPFRNIVMECENLTLIEMEGYAGLGALRYIPSPLVDKLENLPEENKNDINSLNIELVHKLKATDGAFSLGQSDDGIACVKFGLITADTNIVELVSLVENIGKEVEESSKFLETMSERILKGIEEANKDLQRENAERMVQEGLLRQVPLVGSLLNWWSPPAKESIKGRTFSLSSGKIVSTESIYKYHMQIKEDEESNSKAQSVQLALSSQSSELSLNESLVHEEPLQTHQVSQQTSCESMTETDGLNMHAICEDQPTNIVQTAGAEESAAAAVEPAMAVEPAAAAEVQTTGEALAVESTAAGAAAEAAGLIQAVGVPDAKESTESTKSSGYTQNAKAPSPEASSH